MNQKKGWMRIMEAIIAVLILSSVLIILYINNSPRASYSGIILDSQTKILTGIALNDPIRNATVFGNSTLAPMELREYINYSLADNFDFCVKVCNLDELTCLCENIDTNNEIFVEDRIIGGNVYNSTSKLVRLYVWEK